MSRTRYAPTYVNKQDLRALMRANQGRNHFDTREAAEKWLEAFESNNSEDIKTQFPRREVRPVECYDHGDAIGICFGFEIRSKPCFACKKMLDANGIGHENGCPVLEREA